MFVATNLPTPLPNALPSRFTDEAARAVDDFFLFNETPEAIRCLTAVFAHYIAQAPAPVGKETRAQSDAMHLDSVQQNVGVYFDILNLLTALGNAHSTYVVHVEEKEVANG